MLRMLRSTEDLVGRDERELIHPAGLPLNKVLLHGVKMPRLPSKLRRARS